MLTSPNWSLRDLDDLHVVQTADLFEIVLAGRSTTAESWLPCHLARLAVTVDGCLLVPPVVGQARQASIGMVIGGVAMSVSCVSGRRDTPHPR